MNDRLPATDAAVLMALIRVYARDGRATVRSVAEEAHRSVQVIHGRLGSLSERGLVAGTGDGTTGALRPLVQWVDLDRSVA